MELNRNYTGLDKNSASECIKIV